MPRRRVVHALCAVPASWLDFVCITKPCVEALLITSCVALAASSQCAVAVQKAGQVQHASGYAAHTCCKSMPDPALPRSSLGWSALL
jgi:hypothetical protein